MLADAPQNRLTSQRGQVMVLFAIILPLILAFGSLVLSVGNWYVHKRHLQTQVDAAAFAAGTRFAGCFFDQTIANAAIKESGLDYAGDTNRVPVTTFNLQEQQPSDVHAVLNGASYWAAGDPTDDATLSTTLDNTITYPGDPDPPPADRNEPCETKFLDVKATDDEAPLLWGWLPFVASPKTHAKVQINKLKAGGILPFAVPEFLPGAVAAIFFRESDGTVLAATELSPNNPNPDPDIDQYNVYDGNVGPIEINAANENVGVRILASAADTPDPDLGGSTVGAICGQPKVRCYASNGQGLALVHGYESGAGPLPILRRVDLSGCGGYFTLIDDCPVTVTAEIEFPGSALNPQARLHDNAGCNGSGTGMSQSGNIWTASATLPDASATVGQVPFSISWRVAGPGGWTCFPGPVSRPYIANGKSGPVEFLELAASGSGGPLPNAYSIPKDPVTQPVTFFVTVGLRPPLKQSSLQDEAILLRFASEDDPSLTQSIDCDDDNYQYPVPYDTMPKDAAEIANGCVTPYAKNPTLDCSGYGLGDLPPEPPPVTTFENAPDCARSKQGQVASLRKGLEARFYPGGVCVPNNWPPDPTPENIQALIENLEGDPRAIPLIVTDFGQFSGSGSTIVPVKYIAYFYASGWDVSAETPACADNDPHPRYGPWPYKPNKDDGDLWGYFLTGVPPSSSGSPTDELCDFDELGACIAVLVE